MTYAKQAIYRLPALAFITSFALLLGVACEGQNKSKSASELSKDAPKVQAVVNVYTHRHYDADKKLFKLFEAKTGIKVNVKKNGADKLIELLKTEGVNSQADLLITADAGRLYYATELGLLQAVQSTVLDQNVPELFRHKEHMWYALTKRARVIAYSKERVKPSELSTYQALTAPRWRGKINIRSSNNIYNQSLMASLIANDGRESATTWARGIVANFARPPKGNDRDQVKEVALGHGDIAIVNTYYIGKLLNSSNTMEAQAGKSVGVFFPNQETTGTHINISGLGLTKYAPNRANAIKLMEFLTGEAAQEIFASSNYEYPVNTKVKPSALLQSWGAFKEDTLNLEMLGKNNAQAIEVFAAAEWR